MQKILTIHLTNFTPHHATAGNTFFSSTNISKFNELTGDNANIILRKTLIIF